MSALITLKIKFAKSNFNFSDKQLADIYNVTRKALYDWVTNGVEPKVILQKRIINIHSKLSDWIESGYPVKSNLTKLQAAELKDTLCSDGNITKLGVTYLSQLQNTAKLKTKPGSFTPNDERPEELQLISFKKNLGKLDYDELTSDQLDMILLQIDHNLSVITLTAEQRNFIICPYNLIHNLIIIDIFKFEYDQVIKEALIEIDSNLFVPLTEAEKKELTIQRNILLAIRPFSRLKDKRDKKEYLSAITPALITLLESGISKNIIRQTITIPVKFLDELQSKKEESNV